MGADLPLKKTFRSLSRASKKPTANTTHVLKRFFLAALIFCVTGVTKLSVGET